MFLFPHLQGSRIERIRGSILDIIQIWGISHENIIVVGYNIQNKPIITYFYVSAYALYENDFEHALNNKTV